VTDSLTDILAAVSVGQSLTSNGSGFVKSQSWRNALEKAHLQNEWIMQAPDDRTGRRADIALDAFTARQPESMTLMQPSVMRLEAATHQMPRDDKANGCNRSARAIFFASDAAFRA
jgi:hypothetical protein